jgi:hypothetical protein
MKINTMKKLLLVISILTFTSCDFFNSDSKKDFDFQEFVENYYKAYEKEDIDFLREFFVEENIEWFGKKDPLSNDEVIEKHFSKFNKEDWTETNIHNLEVIKKSDNFSIISFDLQYVKYIKKEDRKESDTQKQWMQISSESKIVKIDIKDFTKEKIDNTTEERIKSKYTDRVKQIKEMYKETKSYSKEGKCNTLKWEEIDEDDGFQRPFDRTVNSCNYPDGYKRITLSFSLWDSWLDSEYYFLNDKLFFVYEIVELGSKKLKTRVYFKENGDIEKILVDSGDGNNKVTDRGEVSGIKKSVLRWLSIAENKLKE